MRARSLLGWAMSMTADAVCCSFWPSARTRSPVSSVLTRKRFSPCKWAPMSLSAWIAAGSTAGELIVGGGAAACARASGGARAMASKSDASNPCFTRDLQKWTGWASDAGGQRRQQAFTERRRRCVAGPANEARPLGRSGRETAVERPRDGRRAARRARVRWSAGPDRRSSASHA